MPSSHEQEHPGNIEQYFPMALIHNGKEFYITFEKQENESSNVQFGEHDSKVKFSVYEGSLDGKKKGLIMGRLESDENRTMLSVESMNNLTRQTSDHEPGLMKRVIEKIIEETGIEAQSPGNESFGGKKTIASIEHDQNPLLESYTDGDLFILRRKR